MTIRDRIASLLQEKPRTVEELSKLTGYSEPAIKWHLLSLPVEERIINNTIYIFLVDNRVDRAGSSPHHHRLTKASLSEQSTASICKTEQSYHGLSYQISKQNQENSKKKPKNANSNVNHAVDKTQHGWLTKPLDLTDISLLESLPQRAKAILKLLYEGKTQAQIARLLRITRQAVNKWVRKFIKWGLVREKFSHWGLNKTRDKLYEVRKAVVAFIKSHCQPRNNGDVSSPQRPPFYMHRLQLAYHIVNQSQPFSTDCQSYLKSYSPKGWTGHIYLISVDDIPIRIRALPYKVIAELMEDVKFTDLSAEEAAAKTIEYLNRAVEIWLREQEIKGVEIELDKPYLLSPPEWAFKSKLIQDIMYSPEIFDLINPTHSPNTSSKSFEATPTLTSTGNLLQKASSGVWR